MDAASARVLADGMSGPDPVFPSTLKVDREAAFTARHPKFTADAQGARILRSVLMKPESELYVERLHDRVERLTTGPGKGMTLPAYLHNPHGGRSLPK
ncbi:hypothetical protein [Streptomyces coeruleorubidus]|uniref:hypothetical protein n=1 Tax=Streptomyces coeruleorubidus TaxID=116188 RepID=UPI001E3FC219|nr:hypothetical protein [Streptomyces bellus]